MLKVKTNITPKYLPPDNPARIDRDLHIIDMAAKGIPQGQIADRFGLSRQRTNQILTDKEAKEQLQLIINKHIAASTDIQDNLISIAKSNPGDNDSIRTADILQATKEHNQIIGITGSHTQHNVFINKYYQQTNLQIVSPVILDMLRTHNQDVLDIEVPEP